MNLSRSSVLRERRLRASLIEEIGGDAAVLDVKGIEKNGEHYARREVGEVAPEIKRLIPVGFADAHVPDF